MRGDSRGSVRHGGFEVQEACTCGYYRSYEADTSVRMLLVEVIENQTQTGLSDKSVLLFIIKVQAQGAVQC